MTSTREQRQFAVVSNLDSFHKFTTNYEGLLAEDAEELEKLSERMKSYFLKNQQTKEEFENKMGFCRLLKRVIQKNRPNWKLNVVPTGSTVTGLAEKGSDLDIAIHIPQAGRFFLDNGGPDKKTASLNVLRIVRHILRHDPDICESVLSDKEDKEHDIKYVAASVYTADNVECDISVVIEDFLSSMHNSFLLRHFVRVDNRFGPLCVVVKKWADNTKVKRPRDGGFNSYALVLLVVHFLQCGTHPPILANMTEIYPDYMFFAKSDKDFPRSVDFGAELPHPLPEIEKNTANAATLFMQFLHYYAEFDFRSSVISIKKAQVIKRGPEHRKAVVIEDPLDEHNPGRTVEDVVSLQRIFRRTLELFTKRAESMTSFPSLEDIFRV